MTIKLTPDLLEWAYELINHTDPYLKWNLPEGRQVRFKVYKSIKDKGDFYIDGDGTPVIRISERCVGTLNKLIELMAHEMIHLHQWRNHMETRGEHNAAFMKDAAQVCKIHRFDPKDFV